MSSESVVEVAQIHLLGPLRVTMTGAHHVQSGRALTLLGLLASRHGHFVSMDEIVDALWGEQATERVERNVAALVSRLRRSLGGTAIAGDRHGYRLCLSDHVALDLDQAERLVARAETDAAHGSPATAATATALAEQLLTSDVAAADQADADWVSNLRGHCQALLHTARTIRWTSALAMDEPEVAARVAVAAIATDPLDEGATRALMTARQRQGEYGAALRAYDQLREQLADALGADPSPATNALHLSVLHSRSIPSPGGPLSAPQPSLLVGRDSELEQLSARWSDATRGRGGIVVLHGEAGAGKRTLAMAFANSLRDSGALVAVTHCAAAERSLYLQPIVDILHSVLARQSPASMAALVDPWGPTLAALMPEISRALGPIEAEVASPEVQNRRILEAVSEVLQRLSNRQPVLLVVEGLEHAGQTTVEALYFLGRSLRDSSVLILTTLQAGHALAQGVDPTGLGTTISLPPLSVADITVLVERAGVDLDPARLLEWSGGSPLYVTELIRSAIDQPGLHETFVLPGSLRGAVSRRLGQAGPDVIEFLSVAAVLGSDFSLDDAAHLAGLEVEEAARRASHAVEDHLVISAGPRFRFESDVVRQVAYDSSPAPTQVSRHLRAAEMYAERPEAAARHLVAAEDWTGATRSWMEAAGRAHLALANTEALHLLDNALAAVEQVPEPGGQELLAEVCLRRGQIHSDLGDYPAAELDCLRARDVARELLDADLEARALEQLGWTALYARDARTATALAERATSLAESAVAAPGARPSSLLLLGRVRHWDGDYTRAGLAYDQALAAAVDDPLVTAQALTHQGTLLQHSDKFEQAKRVLERSIGLCRKGGQLRPLLQSLFFHALACGNLGEFDDALRSLGAARRLIREASVTFYSAGIETTTSWLAREMGEWERAQEHAHRAVDLAERGGGALELEQSLHALLALADCCIDLGDLDQAAGLVEQAATFLDNELPYRARAQLRLLEISSRLTLSEPAELLDVATHWHSDKYTALALHQLGRDEEAARLAARVGSALLTAEVGDPASAEHAIQAMARGLEPAERAAFGRRGRVARLSRG